MERRLSMPTKQERNSAIINAIEDGYKQSEISSFLGLSSSTVSKIILDKRKSRNSIHGT